MGLPTRAVGLLELSEFFCEGGQPFEEGWPVRGERPEESRWHGEGGKLEMGRLPVEGEGLSATNVRCQHVK